MPELPAQLAAALADRYTIERELGRGGNATVYLAHEPKHDRRVAIKVIAPELAQSVRTERFLREIQIAAKLTHPHILPIYDSGAAAGFLYYVMPYVAGESLRDRLERDKQLPLEDALQIAREVADALGYAHRQEIVHRDIKPENILLSEGHAVVADFGIARALSEAGGQTVTQSGIAVGTPVYMSPEQAAGSTTLDGRSDLYSLGCVLHEVLAGRPPFTGASAQEILARHALDPVPTLTAARPDLPEPVHRAVRKALAKRPIDRFADAGSFIAALSPSATDVAASMRSTRRKRAAAVVTLLALTSGVWFAAHSRHAGAARYDSRWAREVAIPEIRRLAEEGQVDSAWALAGRANSLIPDDTVLQSLRPRFARQVTIASDPSDASVFQNTYAGDGLWDDLGRTPLQQIWIPNQLSRLRFVKQGYDTLEVTYSPTRTQAVRPGRAQSTDFRLSPHGALPPGMVRVPAGLIALPGDLEHLPPLELNEYLIDKYEVTNREYREFVLAGGYRDRKYWQEPFAQNGRALTWERSMALFVDRTARPGPATWEAGDYLEGHADEPVGGLSWYEAAAYARFRGKSLPTVYHWFKAAGTQTAAWLIPRSNFGQQGPARAGTYDGLSEYGTYDMAGNVREWCSNGSGSQRYILGGGWTDAEYMFNRAFAQSPWDRSPTNGMRLVRYLKLADPGTAAQAISIPHRDFLTERPVGDEMFAYYRRLLQYDPLPLASTVNAIDSSGSDWIVERVSFVAAYGKERMAALVFLPRHVKPPFQTVVFFPGAQALFLHANDQRNMVGIDFVIKSGRAVIYPTYQGTYERGDDDNLRLDYVPNESNVYRDRVIMWAKDLRRAIDYAETRPDLDVRKLAYYGRSWGGQIAPIMIVAEPRVRAAVLALAGLKPQRALPEADVINYISRVTVPVLLFSGRYDYVFPLESSALPFFRLLGTAPAHKRHVITDRAHDTPRALLVRETLDWLDRYLGPVEP